MWFGSDATAREDTWLLNDVMLNTTLRSVVMRGYMGLSASVDQDAVVYTEHAARLRAVPPTTGNGTHCNLATDDDPTNPSYIWAQDHDSDPATPLACSGDGNQVVSLPSHPAQQVRPHQSPPAVSEAPAAALQVNSYAPYAYDATYAIAHALHYLIEIVGVSSIVGSELMDALIHNVSFAGVTGTVSLFDGSSNTDRRYHGDRRVGIAYDVLNFQHTLVRVARWTPSTSSTFDQRWAQNRSFVFSTADNSIPLDVIAAVHDSRVAHLGMILPYTNDGFQLGQKWEHVICGAALAVSHVNARDETTVPGLRGLVNNLERLDSSMYDSGCTRAEARRIRESVTRPSLTRPWRGCRAQIAHPRLSSHTAR
jgi:hypothetical protein